MLRWNRLSQTAKLNVLATARNINNVYGKGELLQILSGYGGTIWAADKAFIKPYGCKVRDYVIRITSDKKGLLITLHGKTRRVKPVPVMVGFESLTSCK